MIEVVAAAIVRDGRVLAALRAAPELGWEFPGGKREPGEDDSAALRRECCEELGVPIEPVALIGEAANDRVHIALWHASLGGGQQPQPLADHDAIRWLAIDELAGDPIDGRLWLPLDFALLPAVRTLLGSLD